MWAGVSNLCRRRLRSLKPEPRWWRPRAATRAVVLAVVVAGLATVVMSCGQEGVLAAPDPAAFASPTVPMPSGPGLPEPLATLPSPGAARPLVGSPRTLAVPILMYHVIASPPADARYPSLFVSPGEFVAQLRYLVTHGYHAVTLQQLYDFWHGDGRLPRHPVVLSFDDGNPSDFLVAAPLLDQIGWPGVLNLIVRNTWEGYDMRPAMVQALVDAGWEIDSHSVQHRDLTRLSSAGLRAELADSRAELSDRFHVPVNFFCYPGGHVDSSVAAAVRAAGYLAATTSHAGLASPDQGMYRLARVRVKGGGSLAAFAASLTGGE